MTVGSQITKRIHDGNDAATVFSFSPLTIYESDNMIVVHTTAAGIETTLVEGAGPTAYAVVQDAGYPGTGSVRYPEDEIIPLPTGETITLKRVLTVEQATDLENQGGYHSETHEVQFDKFIMIDLQQDEELQRAFKFPVSFNGNIDVETDTPTANTYLRINAAGDAMEWATLGAAGHAAYDTIPEDVDLGVATPGVIDDYARGDHTHELPVVSIAKGGTSGTTEAEARTALELGTAAVEDVGVATDNVVQVLAGPRLPRLVGSFIRDQYSRTGSFSLPSSESHKLVSVDCSAGDGTVSLPGLSSLATGAGYAFVKSGSNNMILTPDGADIINGEAGSKTVGHNNIVCLFKASGEWQVLESLAPEAITADIGASYVLLASASPSGVASVDFDGILTSTYKAYQVVYDFLAVTDNAALWIRTDADGGVSYDSGGTDYTYVEVDTTTEVAGDTKIVVAQGIGNVGGKSISGSFIIHNPANSAIFTGLSGTAASMRSTGALRGGVHCGFRVAAQAVDSFQMLFSSGNIASGEIRLYGIKEA